MLSDDFDLENVQKNLDYYKQLILKRSQSQELILNVDNKPMMLPVRMPAQGEYTIIDYVNFVVGLDDMEYKWADDISSWIDLLVSLENDGELTEKEQHAIFEHITRELGYRLASIFGEDIDDIFSTLLYTGKGLHRYKYAFSIGSHENPLGKVCIGGQNNTCLVMINGLGCAMACTGWEKRLHEFLSSAKKARITRIDLAHDDFSGAYSSIDQADQKETDGFFYLSGTKPKVQQLGDWKHHAGDGRTLQIGKRANGKMFRGYEKGKQLGDKDSPWFRCEVELRNQSRLIPFDVLINPTEYFSGFYPYTAELIENAAAQSTKDDGYDSHAEETKSIRIPVVVKTGEISLKKSIEIWKKQIGRYIKAYRDFFKDDTAILNMLETDKHKKAYPKRLCIFEKFKSGEFCASLASHSLTYA